ncbi:hypothetical protein INT45_010957 [Circinella minor]|uniref:Uncharacterized protein n=1 Tax=Circinella minor TaxID=1195481 RepID=A0A8H7RQU4_9FUNG|nr:hypothetical protein INT45_010957 [Circinella minor]
MSTTMHSRLKTVECKASTSNSKRKVPRPTPEELEEAAHGLHSLKDAVQRKIKSKIPDDYDMGLLAVKFSRLNLNSAARRFTFTLDLIMSSHKSTARTTGKRKGYSEQQPAPGIRKSRRLLEKAMSALNVTGENEPTASLENAIEEDVIMIDSVTVTHEEDLDTEPSNYQIHFEVDQVRLIQTGDAIDNESDDEDSSDNSESNKEEMTLLSIAPESPAVRRTPSIPQVAKKKRTSHVVKKSRGKYVDYESDQLRERALQ